MKDLLSRIRRDGIHTLSDSELVSLISGERTTILRDGIATLATSNGFPKTLKQARLSASVELSRRLASLELPDTHPINNAYAIGRSLAKQYGYVQQEHCGVICLSAKNRVIAQRVLFVGTINSATVSPREIVKLALDVNAVGVIMWHTHPSGDTSPSGEDLVVTRDVQAACKLFRIEFHDHIIVGLNRYCSFRERDIL